MIELPDIDQFIEPRNTMDLGFIRNAANPMARKARQGAVLLAKIFKN